jgi:hypothetical protein
MMYAPENTETAGLIQCHTCGAEQRERDRFCRQCGVSQRLNTMSLTGVTGETPWSDCETRPLPSANRFGSFSGALVNLVTAGVSSRTSSLHAHRWTARLVGALVAVPIWLMIVLLSPLDAYIAARAVARQV